MHQGRVPLFERSDKSLLRRKSKTVFFLPAGHDFAALVRVFCERLLALLHSTNRMKQFPLMLLRFYCSSDLLC